MQFFFSLFFYGFASGEPTRNTWCCEKAIWLPDFTIYDFNRNLELILFRYGSWDNIPPVELTTLRNQVWLQLEKNGIHINHESGLSRVLDQLLPSCFRTFSMNRINRCSNCGNREDAREPVQRDTVLLVLDSYGYKTWLIAKWRWKPWVLHFCVILVDNCWEL